MRNFAIPLFALLILSSAFVSCKKNDNAGGKTDATKTEAGATNGPSSTPEFQTRAEALPKTTVKWLEEEFDFKTIKEGDIVTHTFKFVNTGSEPLSITHVKPSCGCTTTNYTKDPIAPGQEGMAEIKFDSHNKAGEITKTISVYGNFENITKQLSFKGTVIADPNKKEEKH
jgi:hypothetical protein